RSWLKVRSSSRIAGGFMPMPRARRPIPPRARQRPERAAPELRRTGRAGQTCYLITSGRGRRQTGSMMVQPRAPLGRHRVALSAGCYKRARMIDPDPDAQRRRALAAHRAFATGLLILMAVITLGTYAMPEGWGTDLLQSAAKAGFVGGIADWFAVTALFRHPLGIPIPHTAILPNQKERLGAALGRFVANHVFTGEQVARVLHGLDLAGIFRRFLADPTSTRPAAETLAGMLPRLLATVEDGRARRLTSRIVPRILGGPAAGAVVARALRGMVEGGRHQEVF